MSAQSVAGLVRRRDPDRCLSARSAPAAARRHLLALYAFNSEVARAAWVTDEPMIATVRLQFWRDAISAIYEGTTTPKHEVAEELARTVSAASLPPNLLEDLVDAREFELRGQTRPGASEFSNFISSTSCNLMWLAALALGCGGSSEGTVRGFAWGAGVASYLRAWPALAAGRRAMFNPDDEFVQGLVAQADECIRSARSNRSLVPGKAAPALLAGWRASATLRRAIADPGLIVSGGLAESEFRRRGTLAWRSATGLW